MVPSDRPWLVHPGIPELSQTVDFRIGSFDEETLPVQMDVLYPMGRRNPYTVSRGVRNGEQSSFTVSTETLAQLAALKALIADAGVLLLNVPASLGLGLETAYVAISDVTISRPSSVGTDLLRDVRMPYIVVDRPSGGSTSERTYTDLFEYATYSEMQAAYNSYADLLAGP